MIKIANEDWREMAREEGASDECIQTVEAIISKRPRIEPVYAYDMDALKHYCDGLRITWDLSTIAEIAIDNQGEML